jgi:hypothetical protein
MTVAELFIGVWFLVALPRDVMLGVMGRDVYAVAALGAGVLLAVALIVALFGIQDPLRERVKVRTVMILFLLTIFVMVLLRDAVRGVYLQGVFDPSELAIRPQWAYVGLFVMLLFLVLLVTTWSLRRILNQESGIRGR